MLRAAREKGQVTHKVKSIRLTADLLAETLQSRREWGPIFNILKEKNFQPRTTAQENKRGHKQIEKHSMLIVRKNQYCENGQTAQSNLQIQCYPHQDTYDLLHRTGKKKHLKLHMEPKVSLHSRDNPKEKEQSWRHHAT